ncbi:DUF4190 domain-containing protein [Streptomyces beijiangensis]|nr:DUF4190 domain-containing protein [Streptomyces beijiangensis]
MPTNSPENPWGPPPTGAPFPGMPQPLMQQPRNGLGVAALVVGVVGVVFGFIYFMFWLSGPLGVLALIFGIVGLGRVRKGQATNKAMAIAGIALGGVATALAVIGLVVTVLMVKNGTEGLKDIENVEVTASPTDPADGATSPSEDEAADDKPLAFGKAMAYEDGVKVIVGKPAKYKPDEFSAGHKAGNTAVQVKVTIVNGTKKPLDITLALPTGKGGDGAEAEMVFDGHYATKPFTGKLLPGKQAVSQFTFSLTPTAAKELQVEVSPDMDHEDGIWVGPTK